jgi:hypothetical protein
MQRFGRYARQNRQIGVFGWGFSGLGCFWARRIVSGSEPEGGVAEVCGLTGRA